MKILIKEYPVHLKIGCSEEERRFAQRVLISLSMTVQDKNTQDNIEQTTNYADVLEVLDKKLMNREFHLVEKVLDIVGELILETFSEIKELIVSVEKTRFPQGFQQGAGICLEKSFLRER